MTRAAAALAASALAAACTLAPPATPPAPEAPATQRGFRAATPDGVELVYDASRRAYAVSGRPGVFWLDGRYYRQADGNWQTSPRLDGEWSPCSSSGERRASIAPSDLPDCR